MSEYWIYVTNVQEHDIVFKPVFIALIISTSYAMIIEIYFIYTMKLTNSLIFMCSFFAFIVYSWNLLLNLIQFDIKSINIFPARVYTLVKEYVKDSIRKRMFLQLLLCPVPNSPFSFVRVSSPLKTSFYIVREKERKRLIRILRHFPIHPHLLLTLA